MTRDSDSTLLIVNAYSDDQIVSIITFYPNINEDEAYHKNIGTVHRGNKVANISDPGFPG